MNHPFFKYLALLLMALATRLGAQTLNWGSLSGSDFANSNGAALDNTYLFELGAFTSGFSPEEGNVNTWLENWNVFDQAAFSPTNGVFASSVISGLVMTDAGLSNSTFLTHPTISTFEGLHAYLWIRKGLTPVEGSEWLLARADSWVFPTAVPGCCDNQGVVEWSVSDLSPPGGPVAIPVWGSQLGTEGSGVSGNPGPHDLQTYTFVPEPTSLAMVVISASLLLRRRRA